MRDMRSNRKVKVHRFIDKLEKDRIGNMRALISKAQMLKPAGFSGIDWEDLVWEIKSGRLVKLTGNNKSSSKFEFRYPVPLGGKALNEEWTNLCKALFVIRFHRKNQAAPNHRSFITAIGYIADAANKLNYDIARITPEVLNSACINISKNNADATAYNLHKHVEEFAAHCDANGLCRTSFQYRYSGKVRPESTGGISYIRLDDPKVLETSSDKLINPDVLRVIGELYQNVPKNHKYRFYILLLVLLFCTGRRVSELTTLPYQKFKTDIDGREYLYYFPEKQCHGDPSTPMRKLYLPNEALPIAKDVIEELSVLCAPARDTAEEMLRVNGPDLRFLMGIDNEEKLYKHSLERIGVPSATLETTGWIRKNNLAFIAEKGVERSGKVSVKPMVYTDKKGVVEYCQKDFNHSSNHVIHIDQNLKKYYLKDMLLIRFLGSSSGAYTKWLATKCTHSMMTTFFRYLPRLVKEYSSVQIEFRIKSHYFRHTLNTLLDEGGLSDLLQSEWFGRANPRDTKAYQHTSREKRALIIREQLKKGELQGKFASRIMAIPVSQRDAVLAAKIQAVHDTGLGICIHPFSQLPCPKHLQCSAGCENLLTGKDTGAHIDEQKRQLSITVIARDTAEALSITERPKKSMDWLAHNNIKIQNLSAALTANGVIDFDPRDHFKQLFEQPEAIGLKDSGREGEIRNEI